MTLESADFDRKPGSVGVPSLHTTVRVSDAGELEVSGPLLFDGYFDDPERDRRGARRTVGIARVTSPRSTPTDSSRSSAAPTR